jgi:hypothetical protein
MERSFLTAPVNRAESMSDLTRWRYAVPGSPPKANTRALYNAVSAARAFLRKLVAWLPTC